MIGADFAARFLRRTLPMRDVGVILRIGAARGIGTDIVIGQDPGPAPAPGAVDLAPAQDFTGLDRGDGVIGADRGVAGADLALDIVRPGARIDAPDTIGTLEVFPVTGAVRLPERHLGTDLHLVARRRILNH